MNLCSVTLLASSQQTMYIIITLTHAVTYLAVVLLMLAVVVSKATEVVASLTEPR